MIHSKALDMEIDATQVTELFPDVEVWVCTKDQANALVREHRAEAWRIWLVEEVERYMLSDPDELMSVIEKKRVRPGPYLT